MSEGEFVDKLFEILSNLNDNEKEVFDFITTNMPEYCRIEIKRQRNYRKLLRTLLLKSKLYSVIKPKKKKVFKRYEFYIDANKKIDIDVLYI